jgi:hypothetical protein
MKAIIDGIRYDTEKAEAIAFYTNGQGRGDFRYIEETLFLSDNGTWFLGGEGGPLTEYGEEAGGNMRRDGSGIRPLEPRDARAWLERHMEVDAIERHFADEIVDA